MSDYIFSFIFICIFKSTSSQSLILEIKAFSWTYIWKFYKYPWRIEWRIRKCLRILCACWNIQWRNDEILQGHGGVPEALVTRSGCTRRILSSCLFQQVAQGVLFKAQPMRKSHFFNVMQIVRETNGIRGDGQKSCVTTHSLQGTLTTLVFEYGHSCSSVAIRTGHWPFAWLHLKWWITSILSFSGALLSEYMGKPFHWISFHVSGNGLRHPKRIRLIYIFARTLYCNILKSIVM